MFTVATLFYFGLLVAALTFIVGIYFTLLKIRLI